MKNFEIRKELYELLGQTIIYTAEFQNRNLMNYFGDTSLIISQIYSCLSHPLILSKIEDDINDEFLLKKLSFIKEQIEEHFSNAVTTAEEICAEIPEKEMICKVEDFVKLIPSQKENKKPKIVSMYD